ncbi:MAG: CRISPR system precrRNA processing endoribonuclease RAMP protein Cas6 [Bacteroidales bacterium]|nr:CRISPR system precrRNA processing endoribonuclease RAMP protein Cas6 [Bacteroidales bacterium]
MNEPFDYTLLRAIDSLPMVRLTADLVATAPINESFWVGAAVRNRFLKAAQCIEMSPESGAATLREWIDKIPLAADHPLYHHFQGGFPKCFVPDCTRISLSSRGFSLGEGEVVRLSLVLFGPAIEFVEPFATAVRLMASDGLGHPLVPLEVVDIHWSEYPVSLRTFAKRVIEADTTTVELRLLSPSSVTPLGTPGEEGYQSRMNGFPSFYQIARSLLFRASTLTLLYAHGLDHITSMDQLEPLVERNMAFAQGAELLMAEIARSVCRSTPKEGRNTLYRFTGYTGRLTFGSVARQLVPLLGMGTWIGVGDNVQYGLGRYSMRINQ